MSAKRGPTQHAAFSRLCESSKPLAEAVVALLKAKTVSVAEARAILAKHPILGLPEMMPVVETVDAEG